MRSEEVLMIPSTSKMKVAMIANTDLGLEEQGGIETLVRELSSSLKEMGVDLLSFDINESGRKAKENETFISNHNVSNLFLLPLLLRTAFQLRDTRNLLIHVHRPDQLVPFLIPIGRRHLLVCSLHGEVRKDVRFFKGRLIGAIYIFLEAVGLRFADVVLFVDKGTKEGYVEEYPWLGQKAEVVPSGVSSFFFEDRPAREVALRRLGLDEKGPIISFVGRLDPFKNVDIILRAIPAITAKYPNLVLAIGDDGPHREGLERIVQELKITERVVFLGALNRQGVRDLFSVSEAFVLASKKEGSPVVIKEALASGVRIVSTRVGDVPDVLKDQTFGVLIEEASEEAIAEGIEKILRDPGKRVDSSNFLDFRWGRIAERIATIYQETFMRKWG